MRCKIMCAPIRKTTTTTTKNDRRIEVKVGTKKNTTKASNCEIDIVPRMDILNVYLYSVLVYRTHVGISMTMLMLLLLPLLNTCLFECWYVLGIIY